MPDRPWFKDAFVRADERELPPHRFVDMSYRPTGGAPSTVSTVKHVANSA
ncbi:MAG TPA: hypothetical protein VF533_13215 [Solirubrobacteraceae bacterium]